MNVNKEDLSLNWYKKKDKIELIRQKTKEAWPQIGFSELLQQEV